MSLQEGVVEVISFLVRSGVHHCFFCHFLLWVLPPSTPRLPPFSLPSCSPRLTTFEIPAHIYRPMSFCFSHAYLKYCLWLPVTIWGSARALVKGLGLVIKWVVFRDFTYQHVSLCTSRSISWEHQPPLGPSAASQRISGTSQNHIIWTLGSK